MFFSFRLETLVIPLNMIIIHKDNDTVAGVCDADPAEEQVKQRRRLVAGTPLVLTTWKQAEVQ